MAAIQPTTAQADPPSIDLWRYNNAFARVSPDTGSTFYPCSKSDIEALTGGFNFARAFLPFCGFSMSKERATVQLERSLLPGTPLSESARDALERLRTMLMWEDREWGPDLIVKTCYDWDKVFFDRRLKGHVMINWSTEELLREWKEKPGAWACLGHCLVDGISWQRGHCRIELNANELLLFPNNHDRTIRAGDPPVSPFRYLWAVLLHEFCHAYLKIMTCHDSDDEHDEADEYERTHGRHFQRCLYAVDRRARELLGIGTTR